MHSSSGKIRVRPHRSATPISSQLQPPPRRVMILYVAWLVIASARAVVAQDSGQNSSMAVWCPDHQFDWVANSMGQSPCYVAGVLTDPCSIPFVLGSLPPGQQYGPLNIYNNCTCNSVFYSLTAASAACQNMTWLSWPSFYQGCMITYLSAYPEPISLSQTRLTLTCWPPIIYLPSCGSVYSDIGIGIGINNDIKINILGIKLSNNHNINVVGGVVGGVAGGALTTVLLFWLYTRRKASQPVAQSPAQEMTEREILSISPPSPSTVSSTTAQPVSRPPVQNLYDSDDIPTSSTFPRIRNERTPMSGFLPNAGPY